MAKRDHYKGVPRRRNVVVGKDNRLQIDGKVKPGFKDSITITAATYSDVGGVVEVYVDAANGDDSNSGLSPTDALKTIDTAQRTFGSFPVAGTTFNINLAGVGGFGASATTTQQYDTETLIVGGGSAKINRYRFIGPEMVLSTSVSPGALVTTLSGTPSTKVLGDGTADGSGLRTALNCNGNPGWDAGDLSLSFVRITRNGQLVVPETPIIDNTNDKIYVDPEIPLVGIVNSGDTVEIVQPGAIIQNPGTSPDDKVRIIGGGSINFDLEDGAALADTSPALFERLLIDEVYASNAGLLSFDRCAALSLGVHNSSVVVGYCSFGLNMWNSVLAGTMRPQGTFINGNSNENYQGVLLGPSNFYNSYLRISRVSVVSVLSSALVLVGSTAVGDLSDLSGGQYFGPTAGFGTNLVMELFAGSQILVAGDITTTVMDNHFPPADSDVVSIENDTVVISGWGAGSGEFNEAGTNGNVAHSASLNRIGTMV